MALVHVGDHRLLKLRNPWGSFEWSGDWGDASPLWATHADVAKKCGVDPAKGADDGVFWMAWGDFLGYFDSVDVLKRSEDLHEVFLDTHEDCAVRACGPLRGCVAGCCCYVCACQGAAKLCCGRATDDSTTAVGAKRDWCC